MSTLEGSITKQFTEVYEREKKKGHKNRATLTVARKYELTIKKIIFY
jgi:hypothetical protein